MRRGEKKEGKKIFRNGGKSRRNGEAISGPDASAFVSWEKGKGGGEGDALQQKPTAALRERGLRARLPFSRGGGRGKKGVLPQWSQGEGWRPSFLRILTSRPTPRLAIAKGREGKRGEKSPEILGTLERKKGGASTTDLHEVTWSSAVSSHPKFECFSWRKRREEKNSVINARFEKRGVSLPPNRTVLRVGLFRAEAGRT